MDQISAGGRKITLIHFVYATDPSGGDWRIACMPNMREFHQTEYHPAYQRTNDVRAVSCPACKKSDVFKQFEGALPKVKSREK